MAASPSIVVTFLPPTALIGTEHERVAAPSMWTVQAPHWAMPQPYFVPVSPIASRSTQSKGVRGSTSAWKLLPLTLTDTIAGLPSLSPHRALDQERADFSGSAGEALC